MMLIICSEKMTARSNMEGALFKCWLLTTKFWEYHREGAMDNVNTKCSQASGGRWEEDGPNSSWKRHLRSLKEGGFSSFWKRLYKKCDFQIRRSSSDLDFFSRKERLQWTSAEHVHKRTDPRAWSLFLFSFLFCFPYETSNDFPLMILSLLILWTC